MALRLKHRWSIGNNFLTGISLRDWRRLLREPGNRVEPLYRHRAALVTFLAHIREAFIAREDRLFGSALEQVRITDPPIFLLGYWRSGTTHLHNLLTQDPQFAYPNTYQVFNPRIFLSTEERITRTFHWLMPSRRPMDTVERTFRSAEEDENATCLTSLRSPYLAMSFPRRRSHYERYLAFRNCPEVETDEWKQSLVWFLKKLTLKYNRPLVLKSPPHTARVRLLLDIFPDARFVHIRRDPHHVFQSQLNRYNTALWYTYLQRPELSDLEERLIHEYVEVYDAFFTDRRRIPAGNFCEVAFEDVERDPVAAVRGIYEGLGLPGWAEGLPRLQAYVASITGYQKNRHPELSPRLQARLASAWERNFAEWGYPCAPAAPARAREFAPTGS